MDHVLKANKDTKSRDKISDTKFRLLFLDIESTNLTANYGAMLCVAWKFLGESKVYCASVMDFPKTFAKDCTNDVHVAKAIAEAVAQADLTCGWYSSRFDVPFINSKLILHGQDILVPTPHLDLWKTARYQLRLSSNRLAVVADFLGIQEKTRLKGPIWIRATAGHKPSLRYVIKHCKQDVVVLEEAYLKLRRLVPGHVNVALKSYREGVDACPICGSLIGLQKRGWNYARVSKKQRYFCTICRGWSSGKPTRVGRVEVR